MGGVGRRNAKKINENGRKSKGIVMKMREIINKMQQKCKENKEKCKTVQENNMRKGRKNVGNLQKFQIKCRKMQWK